MSKNLIDLTWYEDYNSVLRRCVYEKPKYIISLFKNLFWKQIQWNTTRHPTGCLKYQQ